MEDKSDTNSPRSARREYPGSARASRAFSGASPENSEDIRYSKRRLPHFERPWGKYAVSFSTDDRRHLSPIERDYVLQSVLHGYERNQYELYVGCVMPDHVHLLFEPQVKEEDGERRTIFWSLSEILHGIKSSSAHRINKARGASGPVWEKESFDRLIRSEADLHEKFHYICRNPWAAGVARANQHYPWLWTPDISRGRDPGSTPVAGVGESVSLLRTSAEESSFRRDAETHARDGRAPQTVNAPRAMKSSMLTRPPTPD